MRMRMRECARYLGGPEEVAAKVGEPNRDDGHLRAWGSEWACDGEGVRVRWGSWYRQLSCERQDCHARLQLEQVRPEGGEYSMRDADE